MKIDVSNEISKGAQRTLDEVRARSDDMRPYLTAKAKELDALIVVDSLTMSQTPFGDNFKPLKPSTIASRRKGSSKPLIDTGNLRQSITTEAGHGFIEYGVSGSAAVYAGAHQFGVKTAKGKDRPPARPFLPVSPEGKPDFSRGPALTWWEGLKEGLRPWLARGRK